MSSVCSKCGTVIPDGETACPACGAGSINKVILTGANNYISTSRDLPFSRVYAKRVCGEDDARFFGDDTQFTLHKESDYWTIIPSPEAKNQTYLNDGPLTEEKELQEGDRISLKNQVALMQVSFS